jgi:putative ATP-dependent endonuclease of OLD family
MRISRLQIQNFRNFRAIDVHLSNQVVVIGENKIGKSNLLHALRLVLDPSLPDSARQLQRSDFWDGLGDEFTAEHIITISVDISDFEYDDLLLADLAEHVVAVDPIVSRLTYVFRPKGTLATLPTTEADFEFLVFGGDRETNRIGYDLRSRIPLEVLPALRDAERDLAAWNSSPLRPLLDHAVSQLDRVQISQIASEILITQQKVLDVTATPAPVQPSTVDESPQESAPEDLASQTDLGVDTGTQNTAPRPLRNIENQISERMKQMVGRGQMLDTQLGFSPADPDRLVRALRLFIDLGKRNIADASLGSANLLYLTLKALHIEWLADRRERDHTFWAIEEPEAHLHPHLQRLVYRDFLVRRSHQELEPDSQAEEREQKTIILTTHSPHIVSVAPLQSIVLLKKSPDGAHTVASSTAALPLDVRDVADIERYLDVNRGELLFARGVLLVEGDAEEYLMPAFGKVLGHDFDELGISVCSVSGTNFAPYIRLLGPDGLDIPYAVVTDYDPSSDGGSLGMDRGRRLLDVLGRPSASSTTADEVLRREMEESGIFVGINTLEIDIYQAGGHESICDTVAELSTNGAAKRRAASWSGAPDTLDGNQLLKDITDIGKGRFAQRLTQKLKAEHCPEYIRKAISHVEQSSARQS